MVETSRPGSSLLRYFSAFLFLGLLGSHAFGQTVAGSPAKSPVQQTEELQPSDLFKLVSPSVFTVESIGRDGSIIAFGSGVAVDANKVVTNVHVIEGGDTWRVKQGGKSWPATVKYADREHDLCTLEVDGLRAKAAAVRASSTLEIGERVFAIGSPEGLEVTLSDGLISGIRDFDHSRAIQTTAAISKGSSGGGLFDAGGRLVGITTFFVKEGQNLNFALPGDLIASLSAHPFERTARPDSQDTVFQALVWELVGTEFLKQKEFSKALTAFQEAIRLLPDFGNAWFGLGLTYENLQRNSEAAKAYEEAARLKPDDALIWYSLGLAYGRLEAARPGFQCIRAGGRS